MADLRIPHSRSRGPGHRPPRPSPQAKPAPALARHLQAAALLTLLSAHANAADLGTLGGFDIRLDTTVRLSLGLRTSGQDETLLQDPNADDGDRAFARGIISERVDFTSVLDATRGNLGFELSTDGWYDAAYHQPDDNHHAASFNAINLPANDFPSDTARLLGATAELRTAFVRDRFDLAGVPITIRLGRQSLIWGESLFFPQDGIAAGQAPVDEIKELSQPLVEDQEIYLPVDQLYIRADLGHGISLQAYEQLQWRRNRTPGVASYFSSSDIGDTGGERILLPGGASLSRNQDSTPGSLGQFGIALRYDSDIVDLGLYALRYDSKDGFAQTENRAYHLVFPTGIQTFGASASTYLGDSTLAGEISVRRNMPLVSRAPAGIATGETLLALASYERQLPRNRLWQGGTLDIELSATELSDIQSNPAFRLPGTTRWSSAAEAVFTPQYFQLLPQLDLTFPIGIQWGLSGRSSIDPGEVARVGNLTVSASATYRSVWQLGVSFTHFVGPITQQSLADRDFITFSIGRTF